MERHTYDMDTLEKLIAPAKKQSGVFSRNFMKEQFIRLRVLHLFFSLNTHTFLFL